MNVKSKYSWILIAGLAGGFAEVFWIELYTLAMNANISDIGIAIAATVFPSSIAYSFAPLLGLTIHMVLSILLAFGFALLAWPLIERYFKITATALITSAATLTVVWKINFFVLLPIWNPAFVDLLPMSVTLISKVLFGLSMGLVFTMYQKKAVSIQKK